MKILTFNPKCLDKLSSKEINTILNNCYTATARALNAVVELEKIPLTGNLDEEIDYIEYLMPLEDYLTPYSLESLQIDNDPDNFGGSYYNAISLYNDATEILPSDICIATESTVLKLINKLKTCLGYCGSAMSSLFWIPVEYNEYCKAVKAGEVEEILEERFPGMERDMTINCPTIIEEWLRSIQKSLQNIVDLIDTIVVNYPVVGELYYVYSDKYRAFKDYLIGLPEEDTILPYLSVVLVQDIDCILNGNIEPDEVYINRLIERYGDEETTGYTKDELDVLNRLYTICPDEYAFLYTFEKYILDNEDWVLKVEQSQTITQVLKKKLIIKKSEDDMYLGQTSKF